MPHFIAHAHLVSFCPPLISSPPPTAEEPEMDIDPEELAADKAAFKLEEGGAGKTD